MLLSGLKEAGLVTLPFGPQGKENPDPDVRQSAHRHAVAFALGALALVVVGRPGFFLGTLPGKLLQGIAQGLDTGVTPMWLGILATFIGHRRGACHRLQTRGVLVATAIISQFGQQSRSQPFAGAGQAPYQAAVSLGQKKAFDLLIVTGNRLHHRQELADQYQHQARFGARRHLVCLQRGLVERREQLRRHWPRPGMACLLENTGELFHRGSTGRLERRVGLQEAQGRQLLQLAYEVQGDGVVRFEAGGELVHQAGLHLDQAVLVPCQRFEFSDQRTIRFQAPQIGELGAPVFSEQIRIDLIGFGARCATLAIDRLGVDGIDGVASGKQGGNQEAVRRFDDAGQLLFPLSSAAGEQKVESGRSSLRAYGAPGACPRDDRLASMTTTSW